MLLDSNEPWEGPIRPPKDKCTPAWGDDVMNAKKDGGEGFREYCMLNSCTDERLRAIANYISFTKEWDT